MQTTEQSHNGGQSLVDFFIRNTFKSTLQLFVSVRGDERRSLLALVHEGLEGGITCLLEFKVVSEACFDKSVNFLFEVEELLRELFGSRQHFFILYNLEASGFDVATHRVNNWDQSSLVADENFIHKLEIFGTLIVKHILASCLFFYDCLVSEGNQFLD